MSSIGKLKVKDVCIAKCKDCDWKYKGKWGSFLAATRHVKKTGHRVVARESKTRGYYSIED